MPETSAGKVVAIVVISLGLPLLVAYLSVTGAGLAIAARKCYKHLVCQKVDRQDQIQLANKRVDIQHRSIKEGGGPVVTIPLWLCLLLVFCYISAGASVFCVYQHGKWSFVDSFYFAFTMMTTVGVVDVTNQAREDMSTDGLFVAFCSLYLLMGLSIMSMCFSLVYDKAHTCLSCLGVDDEKFAAIQGGQLHSSWVYNEGPS